MYVSIDIETTGLKPDCHQILELAAVIDIDKTTPIEQLPTFTCRFLHEEVVGEPYALALNAAILKDIAKCEKLPKHEIEMTAYVGQKQIFYENMFYYTPALAMRELNKFLLRYFEESAFIVAGKNFASFDKQFLDNIQKLKFAHRTIDVGNLFLSPNDNEKIPNLQECLKRAGINKEIAHTALEDAQDVIKCYRYWYQHNMGNGV